MDRLASIEALVAVVESGSFSRAGERLGISKSLVSRRITQIERQLGTRLLQRTTRTLSLTAQGRDFYERGVRILGDLDEAEQAVIDSTAALRGRIRLAAPLSFGLHHLSGALNDFLHAHPGIELDLDLNDREVNLVEEGFDMAVRIGELRDSSLLARRIGTARFVTCASPAYLARHGTPGSPSELGAHVGLHYANVSPARAWRFARAGDDPQTVVPPIRLRANNGDVLAAAAVAGLGIVTSPSFIVGHLIRSGELVTILQDYRRPASGIHAVFPPGRLMTRRVRMLTDFLAASFGDQPAWDREIGLAG